MARNIEYTKILQDEASFQLVRTNPKLTGNVKLTVDGNDKMWLNSIEVNDELSKSIYKKFSVDPTFSLAANVYNFFNSGLTPSEVVFELTENFDSTKTSSDFKDQYDFSKYFSGARYLASRQYEEKLSYFAPIFLKKDIPEFFVIFKIEDPLNHPIDEMKDLYPYDKEEYLKDLFKKSSIIKTFDLRETTTIGSFIRNYVNDPNFPKAPLNVAYGENSLTEWNGILYDSGVLGSRGELLYDFYVKSNPLKYFEEFITLGFERNNVIFPNILNLEFVFDDDSSDIYDFNRYLGVYINSIELSKMDVDLDRIYNERKNWENTPSFKRRYYEWETHSINQENDNGVIVPFKNSEVYFSDFENTFSDKYNMFLNTVNDKDGNFYSLNLNDPIDADYYEGEELKSAELRLSNKFIELEKFYGPETRFIQDVGSICESKGYSHTYIKINETFEHLDEIKLYHPQGSRSDSKGRYELLEATIGWSKLPGRGDYYFYIDEDNITGHNTFYFNGDGFPRDIASAIAGCINRMKNAGVKAYAMDEYVFIKCKASSSETDLLYELVINSSVDIEYVQNFEGGSNYAGNRLIINSDHIDKINTRLDDILVKTTKGWSKIEKVSRNIDVIQDGLTKEEEEEAIERFFSESIVTLDLEQTPKLEQGQFSMYFKFRPSFSFISFFPINDFDFDFYSSEYLNFPIIDIYKHYYIPDGMNLLVPNVKYKVYGTGSIEIDGTEYEVGDEFTISSISSKNYSIKSGDPIVSYPELTESPGYSLWHEINDEDEEFKGFPGFFLLKDPDNVIPENDTKVYELRDKYLNGITTNEYEYYKENSCRDFALRSKIIPYITKWVIPDGLDSRNNFYRLNNELVFGFNNFTPDHEDTSQNPTNFTHEWFYVESNFNYTDDSETIKLNNSYFDEKLDLNELLTNEDKFIEYFTYTPTFDGKEIGKTQTRYSPILKNNQGVYETFFKGFRVQFKDYIDENTLNEAGKPEFNPNSNRFEDYKFTCLLKPINENINDDTTPPIKYRFIEHKDFKFIILLIELRVGSKSGIFNTWSEFQEGSPILQFKTLSNEVTSSPDNINFLDDILTGVSPASDTINGDYRIEFFSNVSDITYTSLYSLKNKKYNNFEGNFSNIKLTDKLNLSLFIDNILRTFDVTNYPQYPSSLTDEISTIAPNVFISMRDLYLNKEKYVDEIAGGLPQNVSPILSITKDSVIIKNGVNIGILNENNTIFSTIPGLSPQYIRENYAFKIISGGELYFESLFEKISFAKFKDFINKLDPFIEYETYSGTDLTNENANIYVEIPDRSIIEKKDALVTSADSNKPSNLSFSSVIGYIYGRAELDNSYELNRYEGGFSPLFKNIFSFYSRFEFDKNDIEIIDSGNIRFNIDIDDFLKIINFNHIKIANTKILTLESDDEFDPLYEIPNEIAIGRSNYDLLMSNWDYGFHYLYKNKKSKSPVSGTLRVEEDDCFLSKIIKLRDEIELEYFKIEKVNDITRVNLNNQELVYEEKDSKISGLINVKNAIISYLIEDGITNKFNGFLINNTEYIGNYENIEDYIKDYIDINIVKLYDILEVEFYTKEDKTKVEGGKNLNPNKIEFEILNDTERIEGGYKLNKNLSINKIDRYVLRFDFTKSFSGGTLISPKIKIKFR